ncbi:class I SAM-dependent methyltransferase [Achromobacter xylosoxidans]
MTAANQDDQSTKRTADHYSKQWGKDLNYQGFVEANPEAAMVMPGRQLGWADLFDEIRARASVGPISVLDAACGFGDVTRRLYESPMPAHLEYVGADIHGSLDTIDAPAEAKFVQWDISNPLPGSQKFDYVICRAALHHTPDPAKTYSSLVSQLKPGGKVAVSVYAKKAPMREELDDAFRAAIVPMGNDEAFAVANQFTRLGADLQACAGEIRITQDLPFLGIKTGTYSIQEFIYDHFLKCWHNKNFSSEHCDLINFDWYHPTFAYRYSAAEAVAFAERNGLEIVRFTSIKAQHYLEAMLAE